MLPSTLASVCCWQAHTFSSHRSLTAGCPNNLNRQYIRRVYAQTTSCRCSLKIYFCFHEPNVPHAAAAA